MSLAHFYFGFHRHFNSSPKSHIQKSRISLYKSLICKRLIYKHLIYRSLTYRSLIYKRLIYKSLYVHNTPSIYIHLAKVNQLPQSRSWRLLQDVSKWSIYLYPSLTKRSSIRADYVTPRLHLRSRHEWRLVREGTSLRVTTRRYAPSSCLLRDSS
jgi:hypothetical protein